AAVLRHRHQLFGALDDDDVPADNRGREGQTREIDGRGQGDVVVAAWRVVGEGRVPLEEVERLLRQVAAHHQLDVAAVDADLLEARRPVQHTRVLVVANEVRVL